MGRRRTKGFEFSKGIFYFTIKGGQRNITIHRKDKRAALKFFRLYKSVGKEIEWLGKWDGGKFIESNLA